jgi:hypothetical protein
MESGNLNGALPMRTIRFSLKLLLISGMLVMSFPKNADAYLDPGYGSYLFQVLLGLFLTATVSIGMAWSKTVGFLKNLFRRGNRNESEE